MKKGFTLIELMVVVSIISVLSSFVLANIESAKAKGRDAQRLEQAHQIDLATRLYISEHGHAPYLGGVCASNSSQPLDSVTVSQCIAISTSALSGSNNPQASAWQAFKTDISPYLPEIPDDPCGIQCFDALGQLRNGYSYISPAALQYFCSQSDDCNLSDDELNQGYEIVIGFENDENEGPPPHTPAPVPVEINILNLPEQPPGGGRENSGP